MHGGAGPPPAVPWGSRRGAGCRAEPPPRPPALLAVPRRAVVVDALQKLGLRYRPLRQRWATAVLLRTRGLELTFLKAYLDDGGDYHTMYKLAYHDLQVGHAFHP